MACARAGAQRALFKRSKEMCTLGSLFVASDSVYGTRILTRRKKEETLVSRVRPVVFSTGRAPTDAGVVVVVVVWRRRVSLRGDACPRRIECRDLATCVLNFERAVSSIERSRRVCPHLESSNDSQHVSGFPERSPSRLNNRRLDTRPRDTRVWLYPKKNEARIAKLDVARIARSSGRRSRRPRARVHAEATPVARRPATKSDIVSLPKVS